MLTREDAELTRLQAFKDFKVKHPRLEEMDEVLMRAIHGYRSFTLLALYGASGVGKSTVMKQIASRCREEEADSAVVPVVVVQASPEDIGTSARLDYYRQVLAQLQRHTAVRDRARSLPLFTTPGKKSQDPAEWLDMRDAVEYALELLRVKVVFVDEAQHLMSVDAHHKPTTQLDWLKTLTNRTNVLHVLAGNFDLYDCCHLNGQAARRMRDLHFSRYHLYNETECKEFAGALKRLLEQVPLTVDIPDLLTHWRWFGEWSLGCIGVLGDWMVETVDALYKEGKTTLTMEALTRHALQSDQRVRMEMEARTGEYKVARAKAQSELDLQRLLGSTPTLTGANGANPVPAPPGVEAHGRGSTRIERAATRDPVGDQMQTANTLKCTFADRVEIVPKQFLDSGIARVECPECQALRQITPRKGVIRYPSHDKRKTRAPQTEPRWAQDEAGWKIISGAKKGL
jgi:hypothetical protein